MGARFDHDGISNDAHEVSEGVVAPSIAGWAPPLIYDDFKDEWRLATQSDVTSLVRDRATLHQMMSTFSKAVRDHAYNHGRPDPLKG